MDAGKVESKSKAPNTPRKRKRSGKGPLWAKLTLLVASLAFLFVVAEIGLRLSGAKPRTATTLNSFFQPDANAGWVGRPDIAIWFTTSDFNVLTTHDASGLRQCGVDSLNEPAKNSAEDREQEVVWCVGDSYTWGWGVADEDTWVARLNQSDEGRRVFRNLGVPGYSSLQEFLLVKERFENGEQPDQILLVYSCNDPQDNLAPRGAPYLKVADGQAVIEDYPSPPPSISRSARAWMKRHSLAVNYLDYHLMRAKGGLFGKENAAYDPAVQKARNNDAAPKAWSKRERIGMHYVYAMFKELCDEQAVSLVVVTYDRQPEIDQLCHELAIDRLDVSPGFRDHAMSAEEPAPTVFKHDNHWNETGNRIMTASLIDALQQKQIAQQADSSSKNR